ncbi:MAG: DNA starvation/stationary phase protection protein [Alphaproteobacteria bacterium]|nr:DNA starvation/stationary phase protection protein [Alphaproteobacteria bacterium]
MAKSPAKNTNAQVAKHLSWALADTYVLMIKTHGYHWNVTGPEFRELHLLFEEQYNELFTAADEIAERIRGLNVEAPASMDAMLQHTQVKETTSIPNAQGMIKELLKYNESTRQRISEACDFAGEVGDKGSEDLLIARLRAHDKAIWMLRSLTE